MTLTPTEFAATDLRATELTQAEFKKIAHLTYQLVGIDLKESKRELVKARLTKRLRALELRTFEDYLKVIEKDHSGEEMATMIDLLTTNKTQFFREIQHFEYLQHQLLPLMNRSSSKIRFWTAGCSFGQEPFTLAILLREVLENLDRRDVRILATDISRPVLAKARKGIYPENELNDVSPQLLRRYFTKISDSPSPSYQVIQPLRSMIHFARLNLLAAWPMKGLFDAILCRNVLIYFDKPTQQKLIRRFWNLLVPGGHLFIGHSESLTGLTHDFQYVQAALYVKDSAGRMGSEG